MCSYGIYSYGIYSYGLHKEPPPQLIHLLLETCMLTHTAWRQCRPTAELRVRAFTCAVRRRLAQAGVPYSDGLHRYGLCSYGLGGYGL